MIFETHAHYEDKKFDTDRAQLLNSMPELGIGPVVNVGSTIETTKQSIQLAESYEFVYAAAGVHPSEIGELDVSSMDWLKRQASKGCGDWRDRLRLLLGKGRGSKKTAASLV